MPYKENFVITIGDFGAIIALHNGNAIKSSTFIETLNDESKVTLKNLFDERKSTPIRILLDNLDQTYKNKSYPLVSLTSLRSIAKREMNSDGDKNSFKNYIPFIPNKSSGIKKSECLFISISRSEMIDEWVKILLELPNRLVGIYALPVESFRLINILKKKITQPINSKSKAHNLNCLIIQNKIGGIRQIVYSERGIVFTRIVTYDITEVDWLEKYEQDIYSTFEYLKRSFPNINITDLRITNILSEQILVHLRKLDNIELKIINYTPHQVAQEIGYKNLLTPDEVYCDLLISKVFSKEKKVLKFTTPQIIALEKLFLALLSSYALNGIIVVTIFFTIVSIALFFGKTRSLVKEAENKKIVALQNMNKTITTASKEDLEENNKSPNVENIIDLGKIDEHLKSVGKDFTKMYLELNFIRSYNTKLNNFIYTLQDFTYINPGSLTRYTVNISGKILNKTGDIDDLFNGFDRLSNITKKSFPNSEVTYKEIPRSVDFTKKYYDYPIEFTISGTE